MILDKAKMAHEYAMLHMANPQYKDVDDLDMVQWAFDYADAMQAEADKRKSKPELPSLQQTFIDGVEQPRYAPSCDEWQPDWDLAPSDATTWKTVNNVAIWLSSNGQPLCTAPTFGITGCLVVERPQ